MEDRLACRGWGAYIQGMARRGSGLGFLTVIAALAIVAFLVAKSWNESGAAAIAVTKGESAQGIDDHGQPEAVGALDGLPGLKAVQSLSDEHAEQVQEALAASE